ncbi:hypothetical protein VTK56DRAFT_9279 [Thermocarpiscus australiensis]
MMPSPHPIDLTLIVAATRDMGIGRNGTLPWTGLKREMAYFARVTKRVPPPPSSSSCMSASASAQKQTRTQKAHTQNAVIMGRKTWESIPPRFRPLPGRLNVVVSRSGEVSRSGDGEGVAVTVARSLEEAVEYLRRVRDGGADAEEDGGEGDLRKEGLRERGGAGLGLGRVFVIGGAQIYRAALGMREARRILLTRVRSEFECDTFFPVRLEEAAGESAGGGWRRSGQEEMDAWVGEEVPRGVQSEAGTEYEFEMWERAD